ncbi:MAG: ribonuclease PH [Planctomycetes bacterium]|nr:ribonuclease PH [Planctomycetota bacterium]
MARTDRANDATRPLQFERAFTAQAAGSVLVTCGRTKILCTVSIQESVPQWMAGGGKAWLSAEYSMLPGATRQRKLRDGRAGRVDARSLEIQRMIGRALRSVIDLRLLPEVTLWVDCDVLEADGGTRTTAINGACLAIHDALKSLQASGRVRTWPMHSLVAATSVGIVRGELLVDLAFQEDAAADVDLNVVRLADGRLVEVQGTAEKRAFTDDELRSMLALAETACARISAQQALLLEPR